MLTTTEENVVIELINHTIIHVTLNEGGHLTTQLLRELQAGSKAAYGHKAEGYIFTLNDPVASSELCCRVCKKTERIRDTAVAVVCPKHCASQSAARPSNGNMMICSNLSEALGWIREQLPSAN